MRKTTLGLVLVALLVSLLAVSGCTGTKEEKAAKTTNAAPAEEQVYSRPDAVSSADVAKQLLVDGNKRFVSGNVLKKDLSNTRRENLFTNGQKPFAVIVSCSDSRVPPEILFDQALGDLFIVRTAGNVLDPVGMGSVEYGVEHLKAPLLVVMGHEACGAVKATVEGGTAPGSIGAIVKKIRPSVDKAKAAGATEKDIYEKTTDENIKATIADLEKSPVVKELVEAGHLKIVGAKYHLQTGEVTFE